MPIPYDPSSVKYDPPPDFFLGKKDPVYEFWPSVLNDLRIAVKVGLAMQRAYKSIARLIA